MKLRPLGRDGPLVSPFGVGLAALGRPGYLTLGHARDMQGEYDVDVMRTRAFEVLDAAFEAGVRFFDAARSYGRAEEFLGGWLRSRNVPPEVGVVSSKWGYVYTAGWRTDVWPQEVKDHSLANLERQWPETRAHVGPWLRAYLVHSVTPDSPVLRDRLLLRRLEAIAEDGVLVGLSVSGPKQADVIREARELGFFRVVQATWNLLEPSAGEALTEAHEAGMGVVVKEGVANGRLTSRGNEATHPALARACHDLQVTPDVVALAAVLAQPFADVVLSGAATVEQLHSNLRAVNLPLDEPTLRALAQLRLDPEVFWRERSALAWT